VVIDRLCIQQDWLISHQRRPVGARSTDELSSNTWRECDAWSACASSHYDDDDDDDDVAVTSSSHRRPANAGVYSATSCHWIELKSTSSV